MAPLPTQDPDITGEAATDGMAGDQDIADDDTTTAHGLGEVAGPLPTEDQHFVHESLQGTACHQFWLDNEFELGIKACLLA
jgi:hypothetical protein